MKKVLFAGVFILISGIFNFKVLAQADKTKKDDKPASLTKIEIIKKNDYFNDNKKKSNFDNLIKINPGLWINGEIPVFYERRFGNNFSAEIGIGPTFRNYIFDLFHYGTADAGGSAFTNSSAKIGFTLRTELRFYPVAGDFPESYYFAIGFRYKTHPIDFQSPSTAATYNGGPLPYNYTQTNTFTDVVLMFGNQVELDNNFYADYYFGVGIRNRTIWDPTLQTVVVQDPSLGSFTYEKYTMVSKTTEVPLLTLGVKFGLAF